MLPILGRDRNAHVHVIRHQMPFNDPTFLLPSQFVKDWPECLTNVPKQGFAAPFGDEDEVILANPPAMRQALIGFGPGVLLASAHQATRGELYSRGIHVRRDSWKTAIVT